MASAVPTATRRRRSGSTSARRRSAWSTERTTALVPADRAAWRFTYQSAYTRGSTAPAAGNRLGQLRRRASPPDRVACRSATRRCEANAARCSGVASSENCDLLCALLGDRPRPTPSSCRIVGPPAEPSRSRCGLVGEREPAGGETSSTVAKPGREVAVVDSRASSSRGRGRAPRRDRLGRRPRGGRRLAAYTCSTRRERPSRSRSTVSHGSRVDARRRAGPRSSARPRRSDRSRARRRVLDRGSVPTRVAAVVGEVLG